MVGRTKESLLKEAGELFDLTHHRIIMDTESEFEIKILTNYIEWNLEYYYKEAIWHVRVDYGIDFDDYSMPNLQEAVGIARATALHGLRNIIENINKSTKLL